MQYFLSGCLRQSTEIVAMRTNMNDPSFTRLSSQLRPMKNLETKHALNYNLQFPNYDCSDKDRSYGQLWAEDGLNNETTGLREARASRGEKGQEEAEGPTQVRNMAGGPHTRVRHSPAGKGVAHRVGGRVRPLSTGIHSSVHSFLPWLQNPKDAGRKGRGLWRKFLGQPITWEGASAPSSRSGSMALWRAYQRALAAHPWKVQVLTAGICS
ncbi:PREDICTED: protein Mpv17 isoform X7 [Rhinopithecus bieti]|uniref:protein Mpv17 isoform X7 n=1 Tax=Rhinopithecus bieti TaxID=61621 RepID=UPI00083C8FF9|nr:PREDICTED: protein Mpv17 isoform X7 [Rhinopithecus bieti]